MIHCVANPRQVSAGAVLALALVLGLVCSVPGAAQGGGSELEAVKSSLLAWSTADARAALEKIYDAGKADHVKVMGEILAQEGKLEEAKSKFQRAGELAPADPEPVFLLGETYARQGNREQADSTYRRAAELARKKVAAEGAKPEPHLWLGAALVGLRQADEAAQHLQHALERAPGNVSSLYYQGLARSLQQRWQEAAGLFSQAIEKAPRYAYAYYYRGLANSRIDRKGDMLADLENFVFLAPNVPEAENARKLIRAAKK